MKRILPIGKEAVLAAVLVGVSVCMAALSPRFLSIQNLLEMTRHFVEIGLMALPMTLIIITAGIDLSVGSIMGLCAVILGWCWERCGLGIWFAVCAACASGCLAGLVNGVLVAFGRIPPLIVNAGVPWPSTGGWRLESVRGDRCSAIRSRFTFWGRAI